MPRGVYIRTKNLGLKPIPKVCLFCKKDFITNCIMPRKKFCSTSCRSKNFLEVNLANLNKRDKEKQREMMRNKTGEKHFAWIKDRTLLKDDSRDRGGQLHREWSLSVKRRDGWRCKIGNSECVGRLESHHILGWKDHPELRYEVSNGITLCHHHHPRKKVDEDRMSGTFTRLLKIL